jgi:hypothetical protein
MSMKAFLNKIFLLLYLLFSKDLKVSSIFFVKLSLMLEDSPIYLYAQNLKIAL